MNITAVIYKETMSWLLQEGQHALPIGDGVVSDHVKANTVKSHLRILKKPLELLLVLCILELSSQLYFSQNEGQNK